MRNKFTRVDLTHYEPINFYGYFRLISILVSILLFIKIHIFSIPFAYLFYKLLKKYKKTKVHQRNVIHSNLRYFISVNSLFDSKKTDKGKTYVSASAKFDFLIDDKRIIIRAIKIGDNYTNKLDKLESGLSALLELVLEDKKSTINYEEYIFHLHADKRITVTNYKFNGYIGRGTRIPLNNNLFWDIVKQPHLLLCGVTGSGKTTFLNYLIMQAKKIGGEIYICDPKRSDLSSLKHIIGENFVGADVNNIAKITRIVKELMMSRFVEYKENTEKFVYGHNFVDYGLQPVFLIFDELGAFRASADKKVFNETLDNLTEIALKGREMGVFLILSTQQPNAQNMPTELRDNLSVRLAMGNMSKEAYPMVFGSNDDLNTVTGIGTGYLFLDGLGWSKPKYYEAPFLDYKNFDFIEQLKKYY